MTEAAEGLGHVLPWLELCRLLVASGASVQLACPNPAAVQSAFEGSGATLEQLFIPSMHCGPNNVPCSSWEEIFTSLGYASQIAVAACTKKIRSLINEFRPTVVLADYAPIASLVAKTLGIPVVRIGTGYCNPPLRDQGPMWLPFQNADLEIVGLASGNLAKANLAKLKVEECFSSVFGYQSRLVRKPRFEDLIYHGDARLIVSEPELDHYRDIRQSDNARYVGFTRLPSAQVIQPEVASIFFSQSITKLKILVYLKPNTTGFNEYLAQFRSLQQCVSVVLGSNRPESISNRFKNMIFVFRSEDISAALNACDVFITNGGLHLLAAALAREKPIVIVPSQAEQAATAILLRDHQLVRTCLNAKDIALALISVAQICAEKETVSLVRGQYLNAEDLIISAIKKIR